MPNYRAGTSRKPGKQSRTLPQPGNAVRGDGLDDGVWYKCWHCGFRCKVDRDQLGGPDSRDGVVIEDYVKTPDTEPGQRLSLDYIGQHHFHVVPASDSAGQPKLARHSQRVSESISGCPLCGSKNWRGDYP